MNFFGSQPGALKKPTVRKTSVQVPVKPTPAAPSPAVRKPDPNRFKLSQRPGAKPSKSRQAPEPVRRALTAARGTKRKSATPEVNFSDEEEDDSSSLAGGSDSDASRKRAKSSVSSVESLSGPRRHLVSNDAFGENSEPVYFIHGADATSGVFEQKFQLPWSEEELTTVELQYPSHCAKERFELKRPKSDKDDEYRPMDDILYTIQVVLSFYFPDDLRVKYEDEDTGLAQRFNRAWQRESIPEYVEIVQEYNSVLEKLVKDGAIQKELAQVPRMDLKWIKRILDQIYVRTVSPKAEILNAYKNGSDNVYGELLPRLVSNIFKETRLTHEQTFIDLGSGVGNVVLQAALEVGCESYGVEMMKNPCDLADLQAEEFASRTKLWGLDVGSVNLLRGDMTSLPSIPSILQRADVVLVNNQAFTPELNDKLINMFLDLKEGAQVVSLKPFVPEGHKMAERNVDSVVNQFVQRKFRYYSDSVSWSHYGNDYWFIATKDLRPLIRFKKLRRLQ